MSIEDACLRTFDFYASYLITNYLNLLALVGTSPWCVVSVVHPSLTELYLL
jgi:hypothetical protein